MFVFQTLDWPECDTSGKRDIESLMIDLQDKPEVSLLKIYST